MGGQLRAKGELPVETQGLSHCQSILLAILLQHPRPGSGIVPRQREENRGESGEEQHASGENTEMSGL